MSATTREMIDLMEILPEKDQDLALELVKKLVLAWDFVGLFQSQKVLNSGV